MNWKKYLLIGLAVGALTFATIPRTEAGISVGIGFGFPVRYGCYGYDYPGYYPYSYYGYYGPRRYYSTRVVYVAPRSYWHHGRHIYYRRHYWR